MIIKAFKKLIIVALCLIGFGLDAKSSLPAIFIHSGDAYYLEDTLAQAKQFNDRVILLGDEYNQHYAKDGIEYYPASDFYQEATYFTKIYRHMSPLPYKFELACFTRWFILKEFMEKNDIELSFYVDSDVMLYCDITKEYETNFNACDLCISLQYGFCGGLVSYWKPQALQSFCSFLVNFYEDIPHLDIIEDQFKLGGTTYQDDWPQMTNWVHENLNKFKIGNLSTLTNNTTFDSSIWHDYILVDNAAAITEYKRYKMRDCGVTLKSNEKLMKDIIWHKGLPYCYSKDLGSFIQFKGLHFQGGAKTFIRNFRSNDTYDYAYPEPYKSIATLPFYSLGTLELANQGGLAYLLKALKPKTIVELGSGLGSVTAFIAFWMPDESKVYAIDYFDTLLDPELRYKEKPSNISTLYQQFLSNMKHYRLCDKVIPVKMSSLEAAKALDVKPDLIYIDTTTEDDLIYQDIMAWHPKLNNGGIICGNNWQIFNFAESGVYRAALKLGKVLKVNQNFWCIGLPD